MDRRSLVVHGRLRADGIEVNDMAFKVCCSCGDPYSVVIRRALVNGEPLNTDTTIAGYDREWIWADVEEVSLSVPDEYWCHVVQSTDLTSHPSASVWHYDVKLKPFRYTIGAINPASTLNHVDHRREIGPPASSHRHFQNATSNQLSFTSPIRSGVQAAVIGPYTTRSTKSQYDYVRVTINGTSRPVTSLSSQLTRIAINGTSQLCFDNEGNLNAEFGELIDLTDTEITVDLWITARIAASIDIPAVTDSFWNAYSATHPNFVGKGLFTGFAPTVFNDAATDFGGTGLSACTVGPNKMGHRKYELSFDRGDIGGEASVVIGRRSDPVVSSVFQSRPGGYEGSAVFSPAIANWLNVDDAITEPSAGDGVYATKTGSAAQTQGYTGSTINLALLPTGSGTITKATLKALAHCAVADADSRITGYYTRINGSQQTISGVSLPLTTTPTWYTWERTPSTGIDSLPMSSNPRFGISFAGTSGSSEVYLDALYLEFEYDEAPEWQYERSDVSGTQLLRHNASGDYVQLQFAHEVPRIVFVKPGLATSAYAGVCVYRKNTDTFYYPYQNIRSETPGGVPTDFPYELKADAWDKVTEAEFSLQWRVQSSGTPVSPALYFPGGGLAAPPVPGSGGFDPDGTVFINFPKIITIAPL